MASSNTEPTTPTPLTRRQFASAALATPLMLSTPIWASAHSPRTEDGKRMIVDPAADAVAHPARDAQDKARDADRLPAKVLDFFDLKPGMHIADLMAGDGYYTEIVSHLAGENGVVYCQNTKIPLERFAEAPLTERLANNRLPNVVRLDREFDDIGIPQGVDAALLIRFYHDFGWQDVDRDGFNHLIHYLIKPGGVFGVVDHIALPDAGMSVGQSLHRVEPALVRREVEAAGFVLEAESRVLANPEDTHDWNIFSGGGARRDQTDRFAYLFRKPL